MNAKLLYLPRPIEVSADEAGRPRAVGTVAVEAVREEWLVQDRWWTTEPIDRRYFELALVDGRCLMVFAERSGWFEQRA